MDALTLFGGPSPATPERPPIDGVKWTPYRSKSPVKCHTCMAELVAAHGDAPVAMSARFRRRTATTDELLCYRHAQPRRHADGLPDLRAPRA